MRRRDFIHPVNWLELLKEIAPIGHEAFLSQTQNGTPDRICWLLGARSLKKSPTGRGLEFWDNVPDGQ
jgi:hypothetical protein